MVIIWPALSVYFVDVHREASLLTSISVSEMESVRLAALLCGSVMVLTGAVGRKPLLGAALAIGVLT